jgi:hypothetical protein
VFHIVTKVVKQGGKESPRGLDLLFSNGGGRLFSLLLYGLPLRGWRVLIL